MNDFFKNNPTALRHCIRFEIIQGTSIEQAYSNIRSVLGEEVIDYKKFKIRFNHFSKKKFNDKEGEKPCAKILRDDKYALRVCILYEALKYRKDKSSVPIFEVFVNFCKVIGVEDVLKFPEFEFWFYRFLNGEYDLNYERDKEKKTYELMDMPIHVMENVAEYLDSFDRAKLVQTSRSLRIFVEDQKLFHHTLKLDVSMRRATISFNESVNIKYIKEYAACRKIFKNREEIFRGVAYWKQAIRDFKKILNNSKLHLNTLAIKLPAAIELSFNKRNVFNNLEDAFKFTHHLNVKNLILNEYSSSLLTRILPTLKPGYLTSIDIDSHNPNEYSLENVLEMEQWKQAKYFRMDGFHFIWPLRHLYHLKEFAIILERLSVEHILQLKEILFNSPYFGKCLITVDDGIDTNAIKKEFGVGTWQDENNPASKKMYRYPIGNSTDYFEIKVKRHLFEVTRKKK